MVVVGFLMVLFEVRRLFFLNCSIDAYCWMLFVCRLLVGGCWLFVVVLGVVVCCCLLFGDRPLLLVVGCWWLFVVV